MNAMVNQRYKITLSDGREFACTAEQSILDGMERAAIKDLVGCRRGGCGICKVRVRGDITTRPMSRAHVSEAEQASGTVLACCAYPASDLYIEIL